MEAFSDYPKLRHRLAPAGYDEPQKSAGRRFLGAIVAILLVLATIVGIIVYFLPGVIGVAILMSGRFGMSHLDPNFSIPVAGGVFAYAGIVMAVNIVIWAVKGRKSDSFSLSMAVVGVVCGVIAMVVMSVQGSQQDIAAWGAWTVVVAVASVLATVYMVLLIVAAARDAAARRENPDDGLPVEPFSKIAADVARLSDAQRDRARSDIESAISDLEQRQVISVAEATCARKARLGALSRRMDALQKQRDTARAGDWSNERSAAR